MAFLVRIQGNPPIYLAHIVWFGTLSRESFARRQQNAVTVDNLPILWHISSNWESIAASVVTLLVRIQYMLPILFEDINMKVIFLDIDGVLNNATCNYIDVEFGRFGRTREFIDRKCVDILNRITDETGAVIVVSSTWRIGQSLEDLINLFKQIGITGKVIGKTDRLQEPYSLRGNEIYKWIDDNIEVSRWDFKEYVIIDDDSDMLLWQLNHFVHTDGQIGLTDKDADKAIEILNLTYKRIQY